MIIVVIADYSGVINTPDSIVTFETDQILRTCSIIILNETMGWVGVVEEIELVIEI